MGEAFEELGLELVEGCDHAFRGRITIHEKVAT
jgi:hypothetical protein